MSAPLDYRVAMGPDKPVLLYELAALVTDNLLPQAAAIAEEIGSDEDAVTRALAASQPRYEAGEISQILHWEDAAFKLGLEGTDVFEAYAQNTATVDQALLGRVRAQAPLAVLGLISDAAPDWVGYWRQRYQLDRLFHANIIGSELDTERSYRELLGLSAERLQAQPAQVWFVDRKPGHLQVAGEVGMRTIDVTTGDHSTAFAPVGL